jgi:hypothetical protein
MTDVNVADLKKVSKVYRERLVAAGFTTVQSLVGGWEGEALFEALIYWRSWHRAKSQIERSLKELGYEIVPVYKLRKIKLYRRRM